VPDLTTGEGMKKMENLSFEKQLEVGSQIFNANRKHLRYMNRISARLTQPEWMAMFDRNKNIMKMYIDYMKNISTEGGK